MDRRVALVTLWAVAAAASVGVGFGAAGLVGDPFTDGTTEVTAAGVTAEPQPSVTPGTPRGTSPTGTPGATSGSSRPTRPPSSAGTTSGRPPAAASPVVRGISTRGGYVSGSCRAGLVALSASPAVGWRIDEIDSGWSQDAAVHFRQSSGQGEVEVHARCVGGVPRFSADDHGGRGADDGSSGSGGGDG